MLRQMCGSRRLAGTAFEIHNADNLQFIIATAMWNIALHFSTTVLIEPLAQFLQLFDCISATSTRKDDRLNALAFQMKLLEIARRYTKEVSSFGHGKLTQVLARIWRKFS